MSALEKYRSTKAKLEEARVEAKKMMGEAFSEGTGALFAEHECLVEFSWTQYAPYFNDGEECVFHAHTDYPDILFRRHLEELSEDEIDDLRYDGEFEYGNYGRKDRTGAENAAGDAVIKFLGEFDDDLLRDAFGEHIKVTVTREGLQVSDYNHD